MQDYLKTICNALGIKIIYHNNKILMLDAIINYEGPVIKAHRIFKTSSQPIAHAVVDFLLNKETVTNEQILRTFIERELKTPNYKINKIDDSFKKAVEENLPLESDNKNSLLLTEYEINTIAVKDFIGTTVSYPEKNTIKPLNDDFLELDIVIKPPIT